MENIQKHAEKQVERIEK